MTSLSDHLQASSNVKIWALIALCVITTPLGLFVVPLVNKIIADRLEEKLGKAEPGWESTSSTVSKLTLSLLLLLERIYQHHNLHI